MRLEIDKYTIVKHEGEPAHVLRYGEGWLPELPVGANCWLAMAYEIEELRARVADLTQIKAATDYPPALLALVVDAAGGCVEVPRERMLRGALRLTQMTDIEHDCLVLRTEWAE